MNIANISRCGKYRYRLTRTFADIPEGHKGNLAIVMLNPSTADATVDDPTIRRCIDFAKDNGYGGIDVCNLYGYRATDPKDLFKQDDPVGEGNDNYLHHMSLKYKTILVAWGTKAPLERVHEVHEILTFNGAKLMCLNVNRDTSPKHPLYCSRASKLREWVLLNDVP